MRDKIQNTKYIQRLPKDVLLTLKPFNLRPWAQLTSQVDYSSF